MKDSEIEALLWKLGLTQPLREIKAEHQAHLRREETLREKRLQLKKREKEELKRRDELLNQIRDHYNRTGQVGADLKGYSFVFVLGEHKTGELEVFEESCSRLHPSRPIVSLWRNKEHLEEFLTKKAQNDEYFKQERQKGTPDLRIARTLPNPGIQFLSSLTLELDVEHIQTLVEQLQERLYKQFGNLPRRPQHVIIDGSARGKVGVLEITFKG